MRRVWEGMKLMSGYAGKNSNSGENLLLNPTLDYVNDLNNFYNRFDCHDFSDEVALSLSKLSRPTSNGHFVCTDNDVRREFCKLVSCKSTGPDNISPRLLNQNAKMH
ncbi:hypothetical protein HOLleu_05444 [Holothuria leucospilota]|uniref:Uncharacterized protein n=1 Tax=Holothuria leucospilota TaxID=206669 RepID=A0A9Q1HIY6_HOLLE|nr:hypothetical protein HOLleu_05444 [Holothuria leucospilota]